MGAGRQLHVEDAWFGAEQMQGPQSEGMLKPRKVGFCGRETAGISVKKIS